MKFIVKSAYLLKQLSNIYGVITTNPAASFALIKLPASICRNPVRPEMGAVIRV